MNLRELLLQTLGYALLLLLVIGCDGAQKATATTVTGKIEMDDGPTPHYVTLAATEGEDEDSMESYLWTGEGLPAEWSTTHTDASREFVFDPVVPGKYRLLVRWQRQSQQYLKAIPHCAAMPPEITVYTTEGYDMEERIWLSMGMYTSPFEVEDGDPIRIEIHCY